MTVLKYYDDNHAYYLDGKRAKSVTAVAKRLDDGYRLELWGKRQVAIGIATHPPLIDRIAANFDDRKALDSIVEDALTHAKTHSAAERGTAMHRFTERADNNEVVLATDLATATINTWRRALDEAGLDVVDGWTETIVAYPDELICGRMDRIVRRRADGRLFILDLKTGQRGVDYPHAIALQLALYANAPMAFHIAGASGESSEPLVLPDVDKDYALVFAMPSPDDWRIVPIEIGAAWTVARDVLFPMLRWNKVDGLVLPAIVESSPVPPAGLQGEATAGPDAPAVAPAPDVFANLHGTPGEATIESPPPGSPVPASPVTTPEPAPVTTPAYTTREWVLERLRELRELHPEALDTVARVWPPNVPGLASGALYSPAEWKLIDDAVGKVEAALGARFIPGPRNHEQTWTKPPEPRQQPAPPPLHPEDTVPAPDAAVDAAQALLASLAGPAAQWATRILVEARDGGHPIALRTIRSPRLVAIAHAVAEWSRTADDALARLGFALLPTGTLIDDRPLGVMFATLDTADADLIRGVGAGVLTGEYQYQCDENGERFVVRQKASA